MKGHLTRCIVMLAAACLSASCQTTKVVGSNLVSVANGGKVDTPQIVDAAKHDREAMEIQLQQFKEKFAAALTALRSNVQKRWGQGDTKTADKTTYVK